MPHFIMQKYISIQIIKIKHCTFCDLYFDAFKGQRYNPLFEPVNTATWFKYHQT